MRQCSVCTAPLDTPCFESATGLTSMGTPARWPVKVRFCDVCTHVSTDAPNDERAFYETEYRLCDGSDDEDQLYDDGGMLSTRTAQQVELLLDTTLLAPNARVLSLGAAKASTLRALHNTRPDIVPHVTDVTARYQQAWDTWLRREQQAVGECPPEWDGTMDLVYLLFVAEHVSDLNALADHARRTLRPGGELRVLVPHLFTNPGDLVVADHVQHFTIASLRLWLERTGFVDIRVDAAAHAGALFASARRPREARRNDLAAAAAAHQGARPCEAEVLEVRHQLAELAHYWSEFTARVRQAEERHAGRFAIFGAGFYGRLIASALQETDRVVAFLDSNPWLQGTPIDGLPVLDPNALPDVGAVFVGLNPLRARAITERVPVLKREKLAVVYP